MRRLPFAVVVACALFAAPARAQVPGPVPPKAVSHGDSRFQIAVPPGANIGDYNQLGDDPRIGTQISFVHPQRIECTATGAPLFKVEGATDVSVDLTRGDVPLVSFTLDGVVRAYYLPAPSMACALTGDTAAKVGVVTTAIRGGTNAGNAGFTNFDAPQVVTCFERGRPVSQAMAYALSLGAANGLVGLSYTDDNGQPATYEYDGQKTACVMETAGLELMQVKLPRQ